MRDVSRKFRTLRQATARAVLRLSPETLVAVREGRAPKGDPLPVARVAAVQAAKETSRLIPYCHPLPVDFVGVEFTLGTDSIEVRVEVKAVDRTGVEMEALTGAAVAALTLYDMLKMLDQSMEIERISLLEKKGGKSDFRAALEWVPRAAVLVLSDSAADGRSQDSSGLLISERLAAEGFEVADYRVIPDDPEQIEAALLDYADNRKLDLVLTTGGTGLGPRDNTPEATRAVIEREVPGIVEAARAYGQERTPFSMLSRGSAGVRGKTLIVNLPGSRRAVEDYLDAVLGGLKHALKMLAGGRH